MEVEQGSSRNHFYATVDENIRDLHHDKMEGVYTD